MCHETTKLHSIGSASAHSLRPHWGSAIFHPSFPCHQSLAQRFVQASPAWTSPYLEVARVDKPIGTWLLFLPCTWGIALATPAMTVPDIGMVVRVSLGGVVCFASPQGPWRSAAWLCYDPLRQRGIASTAWEMSASTGKPAHADGLVSIIHPHRCAWSRLQMQLFHTTIVLWIEGVAITPLSCS
jgi:hypothetical protein